MPSANKPLNMISNNSYMYTLKCSHLFWLDRDSHICSWNELHCKQRSEQATGCYPHKVYLGGALTSQLPRLTIAQIFWNGCLLCAFRSIVLPSAIVYLLFGLWKAEGPLPVMAYTIIFYFSFGEEAYAYFITTQVGIFLDQLQGWRYSGGLIETNKSKTIEECSIYPLNLALNLINTIKLKYRTTYRPKVILFVGFTDMAVEPTWWYLFPYIKNHNHFEWGYMNTNFILKL